MPAAVTIVDLIALMLAGAFGTLARYGGDAGVTRICGTTFPWGTLFVNVAGSFLFGIVFVLEKEAGLLTPRQRFVILTGFMGAFTTFSTYAFQTEELLRSGLTFSALANVAANNLAGLAAVVAGIATARALT